MKVYANNRGTTDALRHGWETGRAAGYADGWSYGYRLGRSEPVYRHFLQDGIARRPVKVLYVTSGIGYPYPALDTAIIDALTGLTSELVCANPADPLPELADMHKPDLILTITGTNTPAADVLRVRDKGFLTAIWFTDDPYYTDWTVGIAPNYDYVFTLETSCIKFYEQLGCKRVSHLPFAVNPKVFCPKAVGSEERTEICFIGTAYWNRVQAIDRLAEYLSGRKVIISGLWWDRLTHYERLSRHIRLNQWMTPEDTASYYNGAKIVINLHRSSEDDTINHNSHRLPAYSVNPRTFEINACHTLQISDFRSDMPLHYNPGQEIVVFQSVEELQDVLVYYLQHEEERREIAYRGFVRTLQEHTYRIRLNQMLKIIFG